MSTSSTSRAQAGDFALCALTEAMERQPGPDAPQGDTVPHLLEKAEELLYAANTPESGRRYIRRSIENGPARAVQGRRGNSILRFQSRKTSRTLLLESRRGEFPAAVLMERDPKVIAFFAQPLTVELLVADGDGRVQARTRYTPDFLVLRGDGPLVLEYRDEAALVERFARNPHQFYRDEAQRWHYRAAEEEFARMGIRYELHSNRDIPSALVLNERFLEDYLREDVPTLPPDVATKLHELVKANRFVPLRRVLQEAQFSADHVFQAIAGGVLFVDLSAQRLDLTDDVVLFVDEPTSRAHALASTAQIEPALPIPGTAVLRSGSKIVYAGKSLTVLYSGERDICVRDDQGTVSTLPLQALQQLHGMNLLEADGFRTVNDMRQLADCSAEELDRALARLNAVRNPSACEFSQRSLQRFAHRIRHAQNDLDALIELVDDQRLRGDHSAKLPAVVEELAVQAIRVRFNTPEMATKKGAYGQYLELCERRERESNERIVPMSYPTFCKRCDELESVKKRQGKRVAYQKGVIAQSLENDYPVHGTRPHEVCYVDHTIANLATVSPGGVELGKPTLTVAVDGHTTHPRALVLSYDPPSARTVLLLLRDYVRRHGRLPRMLVCDNGKEFHSKELSLFCKLYGIDLRNRPPSMPRGGAMIERLLGAIEEEVLSHMEGNTRQMKDPRLVTATVNPFNRAVWTLTAAHGAIDEYLFQVRPNRVHPALGMTPDEFEKQRFSETGTREHKLVRFDENLMLLTSPHAARPFHKVDRRRGVWVDAQWYRHPDMDRVRKGERVEVRIEPWSYNVVYVHIKGRWVAAIGSNSRSFMGRTRREVEIARREAGRKSAVLANQDSVSRKALQSKERLWRPEDFDARINAQQREMAHLFRQLGMAAALPVAPTLESAFDSPEQFERTLTRPAAPSGTPESAVEPATEPNVDNELESRDESELPTSLTPESKYQGALNDVPGYF
jgi:putative transposase